jgi:hypothetical protein
MQFAPSIPALPPLSGPRRAACVPETPTSPGTNASATAAAIRPSKKGKACQLLNKDCTHTSTPLRLGCGTLQPQPHGAAAPRREVKESCLATWGTRPATGKTPFQLGIAPSHLSAMGQGCSRACAEGTRPWRPSALWLDTLGRFFGA